MPTFSTPEPVSATIDIAMGDVHITASDRDDTVVDVSASAPSHDADVRAAEQTRVDFSNGTLRVVGPRRRSLLPLNRTGSVQVTVELPTGSHLDVHTSLGAIGSSGRLGECRIQTSAGDIRLEDVAGADLSTGMGAIDVARAGGDLASSTGSGSVRIGEIDGAAVVKNSNGDTWVGAAGGDLRVKAANGDVAVDRARAGVDATTANGDVGVGCAERGPIRLKTALGRIDVGILAGTPAHLELHTSFGTVRNELEATERPVTADSAIDVHAETSAGDIVVRRTQGQS